MKENKFPEHLPQLLRRVVWKKGEQTFIFQKVTKDLLGNYAIVNEFGEGPMDIYGTVDSLGDDNRFERIYISISEGDEESSKMIGLAVFTYLAVKDVYNNGNMLIELDWLGIEYSYIRKILLSNRGNINNYDKKTKITPYLLYFDSVHGEFPPNKEIQDFMDEDANFKKLLEISTILVSSYVGVPKENITNVDVYEADGTEFEIFPYRHYKKSEDVYMVYGRLLNDKEGPVVYI